MNTQKFLTIAIATVLGVVAVGDVAAQSARERAEQRRADRAERKGESGEKAQQQEAKFPQATREEPEAKASSKLGPKLQDMFDAFEAGEAAKTTQLADEILANGDANAYEHALAARIAGASLLNDDNARAQAYLQRSVDYNGLNNNEHYESMLLVAQLKSQSDDYAGSLQTIDKFLSETQSKDPEHLLVKGNALYQLERYPEAATALKQAFDASESPDPQLMQLLMASYSEAGRADEAAKLAEEIGKRNPDDPKAQLNLAATYLQAGEDAKATAILEKLRAEGKLTSETDYRNLYAMYINAGGKESEAIAVINEGMEKGILKPDHATYNALGQAYWFSDQPGKAVEAWKKAAPLSKDGETYLNLARALNNEGRSAEARQAAEQAIAKGVAKPEDARRIIQNNK